MARQVRAYQERLAIEIAGERFVFKMEPRNLLSQGYRAEPTGPAQLLYGPDRKLRTTRRPPSAFGITCSLLPFSSVRGSSQMPQCLAVTISFFTPADPNFGGLAGSASRPSSSTLDHGLHCWKPELQGIFEFFECRILAMADRSGFRQLTKQFRRDAPSALVQCRSHGSFGIRRLDTARWP